MLRNAGAIVCVCQHGTNSIIPLMILYPFTVAALVNIVKSVPLNPMKPSLAVKCRIGVWCMCGPVSPPLYCIFEYFFCCLSA